MKISVKFWKSFSFHSKAVETYRDLLLCLGFFLEFDTCENEYCNDALFYNRWQQHLTTIHIELGFLRHFELFKLKTCSLYHENLFIQKLQGISSQVVNNCFSASDVRGHFLFKWYEYYLTIIPWAWISVGLCSSETQNLFTLSWKSYSMFGSCHSAGSAYHKWPTPIFFKEVL